MEKLLRHYGITENISPSFDVSTTWAEELPTYASCPKVSRWRSKFDKGDACLLFDLVIDWIIKITTTVRKNGIQWTFWTQQDDLRLHREPEACHPTTARCRTRLLAWGYHQLKQGSRSTGRKLNRWGSRPLPTHQSRSIESPSGRWSLLITCIGSMVD